MLICNLIVSFPSLDKNPSLMILEMFAYSVKPKLCALISLLGR